MSGYVFNSASNDGSNGGLRAASSLVAVLLETLVELDSQLPGPVRALKLPRDPWDLVITHDPNGVPLSLGELVNSFYESPQNRQLAVFFDELQSHAPADKHLDDSIADLILRLTPTRPSVGFEAIFNAICDAGFEAVQCAITGETLISLAHERWNFDHGSVVCEEQTLEFEHASTPTHVDGIVTRSRSGTRTSVTRNNFETVREKAFSSLLWGEDVATQMARFPSEYLDLAFRRLASLDEMARHWKRSGASEPNSGTLILRRESNLTMQNYENQRRFRSSTGVMKTYERHVWIDFGNRIHLILDYAERAVEIGYVGPHLQTWRF